MCLLFRRLAQGPARFEARLPVLALNRHCSLRMRVEPGLLTMRSCFVGPGTLQPEVSSLVCWACRADDPVLAPEGG